MAGKATKKPFIGSENKIETTRAKTIRAADRAKKTELDQAKGQFSIDDIFVVSALSGWHHGSRLDIKSR